LAYKGKKTLGAYLGKCFSPNHFKEKMCLFTETALSYEGQLVKADQ